MRQFYCFIYFYSTCTAGNMACDICKCHEDEFQCEDGHSIDKTKLCDGNIDCFSGSDEHDCGMNFFYNYILLITILIVLW